MSKLGKTADSKAQEKDTGIGGHLQTMFESGEERDPLNQSGQSSSKQSVSHWDGGRTQKQRLSVQIRSYSVMPI